MRETLPQKVFLRQIFISLDIPKSVHTKRERAGARGCIVTKAVI